MKTSVNIKMEEGVRDEAKALFDSMGLDMTTAVNLFVRTAIKEKAIPFPITAQTGDVLQKQFERELQKDLIQSEKEAEQGLLIDAFPAMEKLRAKYGIE